VSEKQRKPEETICPFLAMAVIIKEGSLALYQEGSHENVVCRGEECQMWNTYARRCGLVR